MVVSWVGRIHRYLRDRVLLAAAVTLLLLAGTSQALLWWIEPATPHADTLGPPRSGYTVSQFQAQLYNPDGSPGLHVSGPWLERRDNDESLFLTTPHFVMPSHRSGIPDWTGHSDYGWVNRKGDLMLLQGLVHMQREAYGLTPATQLDSSNMTGWPHQNRLATDQSAIMTQGSAMLRGVGMRANLDTNELELLHDVHGTYPPRATGARSHPKHHPARVAADTNAGQRQVG